MAWQTAQARLDARFRLLAGFDETRTEREGVEFDKPATGIYYSLHFIPAGVEPELSGADHEVGIYQVTVCALFGDGIGPLLTAAQAVVDHFKRQNLSGVSCDVPSLGPILREAEWLRLPVTIPFTVL